MKRSICFVMLLAAACPAMAETVNGTVTYVAASAVYINAGSAQGIQKGDSGEVLQTGQSVGRLLVEFVAEKSASCRVLSPVATVRINDEVRIQAAKPKAEAIADTTVKSTPPVAATPQVTVRKPRQTGAHFSGHVGLQMLGQTANNNFSYSYYQPGLVMRARVDRLFGDGPVLNVRMNLRRSIRNAARPGVPEREWLSRVYEVSLTYDAPESRLNYAFGRMISNRMAGIGTIDGALLGWQATEQIEVGAFGGTQPDLRTTDIRTSTTKAGAYAAYQTGNAGSTLFNATLAAAGEYVRGQISREFAYEQTTVSWTDQINLYQSAEININRGWRKIAESSALELANLLFSVRYSPAPRVAITAAYDNRTPYRTYETRSLADSLFDTALQQGFRLSLNMRLPLALQADLQGGLRARRSEKMLARNFGAGLSTINLLNEHIVLGGRVTAFNNRFSSGVQPFVNISRTFLDRFTAGAQAGWDMYRLKTPDQKTTGNWQRVSLDWFASRLIYGSASYEFYHSESFTGNRYFVEVGCRL